MFSLINDLLGSFLVNPNKLSLDIEGMMAGGEAADTSIGVLNVYAYQARNLPKMDTLGNFNIQIITPRCK